MGHIERVGLIAKHHLDAAAGVLAELAGWLEARDVRPVFESETAALVGLPPGRPTFSRDDLPKSCDLVLVLGGDGTFIGMASRIARSGTDVPILGVNFGSLGFLTEVTLDELYDSLEAVLEGHAHLDRRAPFERRLERGIELGQRDLRQEAEAAEVDAEDRRVPAGLRNPRRHAQERAIAAHEDDQIDVPGNLVARMRLRAGAAAR